MTTCRHFVCVILTIFGMGGAATAGVISSQDPGELRDIRIKRTDTRLEIQLIYPLDLTPHRFLMTSPHRLVIDLPGLRRNLAPVLIEVGDFGIQRIRSGMFRTDTARVVLDCREAVPDHRLEPIPNGLRVIIHRPAGQSPEKRPPREIPPESEPTKDPGDDPARSEALPPGLPDPAIAEIRKDLEELKTASGEAVRRLKEARSKLDQAVNLLESMEKERLRRSRRFMRIAVAAGYYMPEDGIFKDIFEGGIMEGAEINAGVMDMLEFWAAIRNFGKGAREPFDPERKIRLVPLEAGLKLRFAKGLINPYIGGGAAYHQYREIRPGDVVISEKKIGFVGQAGCFLKIAENLVIDLYAHYRSCRLTVEYLEYRIGGFHLGAGLGFEF